MGIPGLASSLEPYAVPYHSLSVDGYAAIIDGPALAYHAHKLASEANKSGLPLYADINDVAIRWLKSLETINIKVSAILFDGALPASKKQERVSRLQQMVRRVTQFRSIYTAAACPVPLQLGSVVYSFLAPSLMEALRATQFAAFTHIMPGEADDWCASYAKDVPRSIIFTGDSDLLLYAYQPEVCVMFFKDTHFLPKSDTRVYCPSSICKRLNLPSLLPLAYALSEHRSKNLNDNVHIAQGHDPESPGFIDFSRRYMYALQGPTGTSSGAELDKVLQGLDVRISEFVHQAIGSSEETLAPDVYLPLLFEDPHESSAWKLGLDIRLLAYSLVMPVSNRVVREFIRRAQDVAVQAHSVLPAETTRQMCADLSVTITTVVSREELSTKHSWSLVALAVALGHFRVPHSFLAARVIHGDFDDTWAFVHLNARLQAVLYSLRLLKQCVAVWLAVHGDGDGDGDGDGESRALVAKLGDALQTFPSLAAMFAVPGQRGAERSHGGDGDGNEDGALVQAIRDVYVAAGLDDKVLFEQPKTRRQRKREKLRSRADKSQQQGVVPPRSSNVFALLEQRTSQ